LRLTQKKDPPRCNSERVKVTKIRQLLAAIIIVIPIIIVIVPPVAIYAAIRDIDIEGRLDSE